MASAPMNVLLVHMWWEVENPGGVVSVTQTLRDGLGPDFHVRLLINQWDAQGIQTEDAGDVPISRIRLRDISDKNNPVRAFLGWLIALPRTVGRLRQFVRTHRIDVIHLHYAAPYQIHFALLRRLGGPPYVLTHHGSDVAGFTNLSRSQKWAVRAVVANAEQVVAVSRSLAETSARTFQPKTPIRHIYNGVDDSVLRAPLESDASHTRPLPALPDAFYVTVGNLHHHKGHDILIDAWPEVLRSHPDLHLVIVGGGDRMGELKARAESRSCGERVRFAGPVSRSAVFAVLQRAQGFLFPSRNEGMGIALIEAGAFGLPVVCSRIPVFEELIDDGRTGLLANSEDPAGFARAVRRLMDEPALAERLSAAFQAEVRERYSLEAMVDGYRALYRTVTS